MASGAGDETAQPSLSERVYQELSRAIRDGRYNPGDHLREAAISKRMGVSRTPVREAMHRLQSEGWVRIERQRGAVVAELDRQEVVELYVLREELERIAARFAAQHASEVEISAMRSILARSHDVADDCRRLNQVNWELHDAIANAAHNRFLLRARAALSDSMALLRGDKYIPTDRPATLHAEHERIVEAIAARLSDEAGDAAQAHVRNAFRIHLELAFNASGEDAENAALRTKSAS